MSAMKNLDLAIVVVYLVALFAWAIYIGLKETADDFLVFSRRAPVLLVAFSMIATWVGSGTTVATASSGFDTGISLGLTAASGGLLGVIVAAWFAPRLKSFGDEYGAHTIGDFFLVRYSSKARLAASFMILVIYILLSAAQFVGLATLLNVWTGVGWNIVIWFAAISTILYTAFAGIKSDFYTDIIHFLLMLIIIFVILLPVTLNEIGGFGSLQDLPQSYFDPFAYGGVAFFIAGLIFGLGGVFVTMEVWQRIYSSSTGRNARIALLVSAFFIIAFYLSSSVLGMTAKLISPDLPDRDQAIFVMMKDFLPTGILGLGVAGFMAVFISTVNSTIMVASATMTKDFYKGLINKEVDDSRLLLVGRISTVFCGGISLAVAVVMPNLVALSVNALFLLLILVPAIVGGFFWNKANSTGAASSIVAGLLVTCVYMAIDPDVAFVPGFITSLVTFILVSRLSSHSTSENNLLFFRGKSEDK